MGSQTPSRFGEQDQNDDFQNEHLSFCFILKVFFKKKKKEFNQINRICGNS